MYKNKASIFKFLVVCLFAILFTVSCIDESIKPDNNDTKDKAEYTLEISGYKKDVRGYDVDSNWDSELGIVWLGTGEEYLPTGTLTIFIDTIITVSGEKQAWISSAILSTVDALTGTGEEINGKTYSLLTKAEMLELGAESGIQWLSFVEIGANYIEATIGRGHDDAPPEGWFMRETTTNELVRVDGTFTALSNN